MGVLVLGPVQVDGARSLEPRDRMALGVLTVRRGQSVAPDEFADALWGEQPPTSWQKQVQICIGRLRKVLSTGAIETTPSGYRLTLDGDDLDVCEFERLVTRGRELTAVDDHDRAAATYRRALVLWRGPPHAELDGWMPGRGEAVRLEELRRAAEEDWLAARLDCGEQREVAAAAEAMVNDEPLRERRWAILALAQYRCARQVDALRSLARARTVLLDLGVEPGAELIDLEQAILRQDPALTSVAEPAAASDACPYKGLANYDERDAEAFFGRDADVDACLERLRATPLLVVTGPSGSGKSSLVRAGVVPALRRHGSETLVFTPGSDPAGALADAARASDAAVWVVDQFEELFTLGASRSDVLSFCRTLVLRAHGGTRVIIAVRIDQLGGISVDAELSDLAERGLHFVSTLAGDDLRAAIEQPAHLAGLRLEHGLADLLVRDCEGEPGGLPLLSHALAETWRRRDGQTLTIEGYESSGGIRVAVARSADRLYDSLPAEQRATLRSILLRLVTPTLDGDPVRCRVSSRSLLGDPGRDRVVALLVRARLVTSEKDTFEIAHEALARAWPRLRSWLDDDVAGQRILRHLVTAADGWDSLGRPDTELYRGARLEAAREWLEHADVELTELESEFVEASVELADTEQRELQARAQRERRSNRRLRGLVGALALVLVASMVAGGLAVRESRRASRAGEIATVRELAAAAEANLEVDPERSVLLALAAVERARHFGGALLGQTVEALHASVGRSQLVWRGADTGDAVDWSPDNRHFVTEGPAGSGRVDIRDVDSREAVRSLDADYTDVTGVAYNADGTLLGTTGLGGTAQIWDGVSGDRLLRVDGPAVSAAWAPSFSPDGSLFGAAWPDGGDGLVRIVRVASGEVVRDIHGVSGVRALSWSPDSSQLAIASDETTVAEVFDVASGDQVLTLAGHIANLSDIEWSPDGGSIATSGGDGSARVFDASTGDQRIVIPAHRAGVGAVSWSTDSTRVATASTDGTARVWLVIEGGGRRLMTLTADDMRSGFDDIVLSPDGDHAITSSESGIASIWNVGLSAGAEVAALPSVGFSFNAVEFSDDGHQLYASSVGGRAGVWDTATWERVRTIGPPASPTPPAPAGIPGVKFGSNLDLMRIAPSPDGTRVATNSDASTTGDAPGGRVDVWDPRSGEHLFEVALSSWSVGGVWSPDSQFLAVSGGDERGSLVRLVDRSGALESELQFPGELESASFSHDGSSLIVAIEPRGRYDPDVGRVEVWDWRRRELEQTIDIENWGAVPNPTNDLIAVAPHIRASSQDVTTWDAGTGEKVATLVGNTGSVNSIAISRDGTRVAAAGGDGTVPIWDASTGELLLSLDAHLGFASAVSFSPDGTQLATTGADGVVRVWALDVDTLVEIAEDRVTRTLTEDECRRYLDQPSCSTN